MKFKSECLVIYLKWVLIKVPSHFIARNYPMKVKIIPTELVCTINTNTLPDVSYVKNDVLTKMDSALRCIVIITVLARRAYKPVAEDLPQTKLSTLNIDSR